MNNRILGTILMGACMALGLVILPAAAEAQGVLRYQNRYSKSDVGRIIAKLESSSNSFRSDFDRAMDRSNLNGTSEEDRYNGLVKDYENALDGLRRDFDRSNSWGDARNNVSNAIQRSQRVNDMMNSISFRRNLERQWSGMRNDINTLADTFDLPGLNGGGWMGGGGIGNGGWNGGNNGGTWGGSGNISRPPTWAQGTFYSMDGNIVLTIDNGGRAIVVNGGQTYFGNYYRGNLSLNGDTSAVQQSGNGIRTYNRNSGQTTMYTRNQTGNGGWNGGNNGGNNGQWGGSGNVSNAPSWAQGTFYSADGNITLSIDGGGRATVINGGQTFYGNYYRGNLTLNGDTSSVSQSGDGIRTYNRSNGQTTIYTRNSNGNGGWNGGNNGGNNGGWNGSGNTSTPPSWAQGTFYSTDGTNISLAINRNGQVTAMVNGQMYYGTYYNSSLTLNGDTSTVSRNGDGIRTYNTATRETTNYRR